jgi:hypothetical protein
MRFPECLLQWMQVILILRQSFNSSNVVSIRLHSKHQTGTHRFTIQQDCAGATDTMLAADVGTGESEFMP